MPSGHDHRCPLARPYLYNLDEDLECMCAELRASDQEADLDEQPAHLDGFDDLPEHVQDGGLDR